MSASSTTAGAAVHAGTAPRLPGLRVLVLSSMYPSERAPTKGTFVAEQVDALRAHPGVEGVDVIAINGSMSRLDYARALVALHRAVRRKPYDLVHAHYGLAGFVAVTQRRVPVVITFHGSDLAYFRWHRAVSRLAARLAARVIVVADVARGLVGSPAVHLPCGIDTVAFAPSERAAARARYGLRDGTLALLFPGLRERPQKGYARFRLVREALEARGHDVAELRLENVPRREVPALFAAADALVLTSLSEGSPVSVMEALAAGLPVVATPVGDIPAMLAAVEGCFVAEFDAERFATAIEEAPRRHPRVPAARSRRFDQERITAGLVDLYRRTVARAER